MPKQTKRIRVSREASSSEAAGGVTLVRMGFSKEVRKYYLARGLVLKWCRQIAHNMVAPPVMFAL
jgi:hypothetical protein